MLWTLLLSQTGRSHMALVSADATTIEACWQSGQERFELELIKLLHRLTLASTATATDRPHHVSRHAQEIPEHVRILGLCTIEDVMEEIIGEEARPAQHREIGARSREIAISA